MTLTNPDLADTLTRIANQGAEAFYEGPIAESIVATVQANGGKLTQDDMAGYQALKREPVCRSIAEHISVCSIRRGMRSP